MATLFMIKKNFLLQAKQKLDQLTMPYYVTKGNHDMVSDDYWKEVWGVPVNYEKSFKKNTFLMLTTSNEKGEYLSPDLDLAEKQTGSNIKNKRTFSCSFTFRNTNGPPTPLIRLPFLNW